MKRMVRFVWLVLVAALAAAVFSADLRPLFGDASQAWRDARIVLRYRTKVDGSASANDFRKALTPEELEEDFDGDGLSNAEELQAGTQIYNADTDRDGLDDRLEIDCETNPGRWQSAAFTTVLPWSDREACFKPAAPPQLPNGAEIEWRDSVQTPYAFVDYTGGAFDDFGRCGGPFILLGRKSRSLRITVPVSSQALDAFRNKLEIGASFDVTFILASYDAAKNRYKALASADAGNNSGSCTLTAKCPVNTPLCIVAAAERLNGYPLQYYALSHYMKDEPERFVCINSNGLKIVFRAVPSAQTRPLEVPVFPSVVSPRGWRGVVDVHEGFLEALLKADAEQAAYKKDRTPLPKDPFRLSGAFPWLERRLCRWLVRNYTIRHREAPLGDAVASAAFNEKMDRQELRKARRTVIAETKFDAQVNGFGEIARRGYSPAMAELAAEGFNKALGTLYLQNPGVHLEARRGELKNLYLSKKDKAPVSTKVLTRVNERLEAGKVVPAYLVKGGRVHAVVVYAAERDAINPNVIYYKVYDPIYPGGNLTAFDKNGLPLLSLRAGNEIRIEIAQFPVVQMENGAAKIEAGSDWSFSYDDGYGNAYHENLYFRDEAMGFLH